MVQTTSIATRIDQIPPGANRPIRRGFAAVGHLADKAQIEIISHLIAVFGTRYSTLNLTELGERFGITTADAGDVVSALSAVAGVLIDYDASPEAFVEAASGKIFDEKDRDIVRRFAQIVVDQRKPLRKSLDQVSLAAQTLPSLESFDVTVDIRPQFSGNSINGGVSIALVHIGTDSQPEIWLQLRKDEVSHLIEKLRKAEGQMQSAEDFLSTSFDNK